MHNVFPTVYKSCKKSLQSLVAESSALFFVVFVGP